MHRTRNSFKLMLHRHRPYKRYRSKISHTKSIELKWKKSIELKWNTACFIYKKILLGFKSFIFISLQYIVRICVIFNLTHSNIVYRHNIQSPGRIDENRFCSLITSLSLCHFLHFLPFTYWISVSEAIAVSLH